MKHYDRYDRSDHIKCILCDLWWLWLLILFLIIAALLTRQYWTPLLGLAPTGSPPSGSQQTPPAGQTTPQITARVGQPTTSPMNTPTSTAVVQVPATNTPTNPTVTPISTISSGTPGNLVGMRAPTFQLTDLQGNQVSLVDYANKPVLLVFFASWCPHCNNEAPHLNQVYDEYLDKGLQILAVDIAFNDTVPDVQKFVERHGWKFPILLDKDGSVMSQYQQDGVPANIFIAKDGNIQNIQPGEMTADTIKPFIEQIIQ